MPVTAGYVGTQRRCVPTFVFRLYCSELKYVPRSTFMAPQPLTDGRSGAGLVLQTSANPITLDLAKTAILVIDMQNDFGSEGGMFDRAGIDISMIQKAVGTTAKVLAEGRKAGIKIIYLKMAFRP